MIDLHCHSRYSDNSMGLPDLFALAAARGVTHLAITDHDTTKGLGEAQGLGARTGITVVPGIEVTAYDYERSRRAHILGYFVMPGMKELERLCEQQVARRQQASFEMVERIIHAGYDIEWAEVERLAEGGTGVYKQHIMHALMIKGYTRSIYGPLYRELFARGENGGEPGKAYIPLVYTDVYDAIRAIRRAGGVPVLAHPGQFDNFAAIGDWMEAGLQGIEVLHPLHGPAEEALASEYARNYGLAETGGSDFHGLYGENDLFPLGSKNAGIERYERLIALHQASRQA